ncbi:TPA: hypothetical protein ACFNMW_000204 [Neisseria lactamica]|uniref:hypothetical protein n=1 Tax=Neisseria lactamica TaxID=486 RepID=UPI0012905BE8|nr:hypothetical protein [Neisseria lactamica]
MPSEDEGSTFCPVPALLPFYAAPPFADGIAHFFISADFSLSVKILSHLSTTGYTQVQDKACGDWGFFRRRTSDGILPSGGMGAPNPQEVSRFACRCRLKPALHRPNRPTRKTAKQNGRTSSVLPFHIYGFPYTRD